MQQIADGIFVKGGKITSYIGRQGKHPENCLCGVDHNKKPEKITEKIVNKESEPMTSIEDLLKNPAELMKILEATATANAKDTKNSNSSVPIQSEYVIGLTDPTGSKNGGFAKVFDNRGLPKQFDADKDAVRFTTVYINKVLSDKKWELVLREVS